MKSDGIYVKYLDKDCNILLFRKAMIDGRLFLAITNEKKVLAIKSWEDTNMEMFSPGPCLVLDKDGNVLEGKL